MSGSIMDLSREIWQRIADSRVAFYERWLRAAYEAGMDLAVLEETTPRGIKLDARLVDPIEAPVGAPWVIYGTSRLSAEDLAKAGVTL